MVLIRLGMWFLLGTVVFGACSDAADLDLSPGVAWDLASHRAETISDIRYRISLDIPDDRDERIRGHEVVSFGWAGGRSPVVLDFKDPAENVIAVLVDGEGVPYETINDHLVVPASVLQQGDNAIEIEFLAGDGSLNRTDEFLYTLFVPDRARFALPVFDQPNLKAKYALELEMPANWRAAANGAALSHQISGDRATVVFNETRPISTYLFAFAAGEFQVETAERDGRTMRMYHRETDDEKVARNREAIFDLHASALGWLEEYTDIEYPFEKFDFVLIPSFQYGGMEHPGSILYRQTGLMLDETATQNQMLGRASVIAHETAHMWFGDLVTMDWFDDVWMKEVFANFMAAKIVNPSFPEVDHDLRFFLSHYPAAYNLDRTRGANPIRQQLDNLQEAGTLYGAAIYQKAPIVMKHLERLMGEEEFRDGLREYLAEFRFGNATWQDLIDILDRRIDEDLTTWSAVWVNEARRPIITTQFDVRDGVLTGLTLTQADPEAKARLWGQRLDVLLGYADGTYRVLPVNMTTASVEVPGASGLPVPAFVLANGSGIGYGHFDLDPTSLNYLMQYLPTLRNYKIRAIAWMNMWEAMLAQRVSPVWLLHAVQEALLNETNELTTQRLLGYLTTTYWRYIPSESRTAEASEVEALLWRLLNEAPQRTLKSSYFAAYRNAALSAGAVQRLQRIWSQDERVPGITLSERDFTALAAGLAIRNVEEADQILEAQQDRIDNPDRKAQFEFVMPALSAEQELRDGFFERLKDERNREREPWALQGMGYLHHPLRAATSEKYIRPSLDLLEDIQRTGDIFFPQRWLGTTLNGHNGSDAAAIVQRFLDEVTLPPRLLGKLLQAADPLFTAAAIVDGYEGR